MKLKSTTVRHIIYARWTAQFKPTDKSRAFDCGRAPLTLRYS